MNVSASSLFNKEISALLPADKAFEFIHAAKDFFAANPKAGHLLQDNTRVRQVPDPPNQRVFLIYYRVEGESLTLESVQTMGMTIPTEVGEDDTQ